MADSDFDFDAPTTLHDGEGEADSIDDALFGEARAFGGPVRRPTGASLFGTPAGL